MAPQDDPREGRQAASYSIETASSAASSTSKSPSYDEKRSPDQDAVSIESGSGSDIEANPALADDKENTGDLTIAQRILTRISTKSSWKDPGPPPDGGFKAWLQCAMGLIVIMNTWGFINSFGVFQAFYVDFLHRPPSDIAWIGSIQVFLLFFIGTAAGRATDAGFFREVFLLGTVLQLLGIFMASLSTQYWQLFLAQGVCVGIGNGCMFTPMVSLVATYFSTKKSLAIGIAASGSSVGGLIFPVMVQKLLPLVGFGWTMRCLGFVELACLIVVNAFCRQRVPPRRSGPLIDVASFKDPTFVLFGVGMFFTFWGVYFAFFYLGAYGRDVLAFPQSESINILLVLNGVGIVGRLVPNHLADRIFGPLNLLIPVVVVSSVTVYCMIVVDSRIGVYLWATAYGLVGAAIQSLFPATLGSMTTDLSKVGTRMGMVFTTVSFAVLTGPPIAGALIQAGGGSYLYAEIFAASSMMLGAGLMFVARIKKTGWVLKYKM